MTQHTYNNISLVGHFSVDSGQAMVGDPCYLDENASFDGHMFETYDGEVAFVKEQDPAYIWMYGDGDDGGSYIWNGWHIVNRIGYFVTEVPCPPDTTIQVLISHNWFYCENCGAEFEDPDNTIRDAFDEHDLEKCPQCGTVEELKLVGVESPKNANL